MIEVGSTSPPPRQIRVLLRCVAGTPKSAASGSEKGSVPGLPVWETDPPEWFAARGPLGLMSPVVELDLGDEQKDMNNTAFRSQHGVPA